MNKEYRGRGYDIYFNLPDFGDGELKNIIEAQERGRVAGDGYFTSECHTWLEGALGAKKALLTHSATAALEMMVILSDVQPGDEVIMPSFTFVSTANAVALRGATPVFVDIRPDTLNIDETLIEEAITPKTKAIMPIHYAGVACEMDVVNKIAKEHQLLVLEDAAQGIMAKYKGNYLSTLGDMAAISFHETKNIIAGEGGAIIINNEKFIQRAEIIREKGTNRSSFQRGEVDKYTWVDIGSSYLPGELVAAFLKAQLDRAQEITQRRIKLWEHYHFKLKDLEKGEFIRRPIVPIGIEHNAHTYYLLTRNSTERKGLMSFLENKGILSVFHYVPLHSSPAGVKYGKTATGMEITDDLSQRLVRLPLHNNLKLADVKRVIETIYKFYKV